MNEREVLLAADAVFDAERALRRAADMVDDLGDIAASSLRVLEDVASDSFYAHQEEQRDFYLESAGEHLVRLHDRSDLMNEVAVELSGHLDAASNAIERAGVELTRSTAGDEWDKEVQALRGQIDVLSEVVAVARPIADQITGHAQHAAEAAAATDASTLLDERIHRADHRVTRADEGVSMVRSVIQSAQGWARTSAESAGALVCAASQPAPPQQIPKGPANPGVAI